MMVTLCGNFMFWQSFDKASLLETAFRLVLARTKILATLRFSLLSSTLLRTSMTVQISYGHFDIISSILQSFCCLTGYFLIPENDTTLKSSVQINWPDHFYQFNDSHQAADSTHSTADMMLKTGYWQILENTDKVNRQGHSKFPWVPMTYGTSTERVEVEGLCNILYIHFTDHNEGLLI